MSDSLRIRKRERTRERIAAAAARLVMENGLTGATTDRIAAEAGVARATFFRYFESKEYAVAEGFTAMWIAAITDALRRQPPELSATDALAAAVRELAAGFEAISGQIADIDVLVAPPGLLRRCGGLGVEKVRLCLQCDCV